jgi:hypothetical protein
MKRIISLAILTIFFEIIVIGIMGNMVFPNSVEINTDQVKNGALEALDILEQCDYFKFNYPKQYKEMLEERSLHEIAFYYTKDPKFSDICGIGIRQGHIILLTEIGLHGACGPLSSLITHEMLHVFGMPLHKIDDKGNQIVKNDPVYLTELVCTAVYSTLKSIKERFGEKTIAR